MFKSSVYALVLSLLAISLSPEIGRCWHSGYHGRPAYHYGGGYYRHPRYYHGHHYGNDAWVWGLGGLVFGSALTAAFLYPPPVQVVYAPPPTPVYSYKPNIPPGMCRWERQVLDSYGRPLFDKNGRPVLEYTIGSCQYPPY